jgi:hypothetical protein
MSLTQTGSTRRRHGKHLKSIWTTAAPWFSNPPEYPDRLAEKPPPKEILAQRSGELRSCRMKTAVNSPESAVYRRGLGIFLTETPLTAAPKHLFGPLFPRNPHFPALWSDPMAVSKTSRRKQIPSSRGIDCSWRRIRQIERYCLLIPFRLQRNTNKPR